MKREELLNTAEYWQEMAENQCWREDIKCKIHLIDSNKQWHKVADGDLPPRIKETFNVSKTVIVSNGLSYGIGYYNYNFNKWFSVGTTNITHWMPLPKLPKEE